MFSEDVVMPLYERLKGYEKFGDHSAIQEAVEFRRRLVEAIAPPDKGQQLSTEDEAIVARMVQLMPGLQYGGRLSEKQWNMLEKLEKLSDIFDFDRLPHMDNAVRSARGAEAAPAAEWLRDAATRAGAPTGALEFLEELVVSRIHNTPQLRQAFAHGDAAMKRRVVEHVAPSILSSMFAQREIEADARRQTALEAVQGLPAASRRAGAPAGGGGGAKRLDQLDMDKATDAAWEIFSRGGT